MNFYLHKTEPLPSPLDSTRDGCYLQRATNRAHPVITFTLAWLIFGNLTNSWCWHLKKKKNLLFYSLSASHQVVSCLSEYINMNSDISKCYFWQSADISGQSCCQLMGWYAGEPLIYLHLWCPSRLFHVIPLQSLQDTQLDVNRHYSSIALLAGNTACVTST